MSFTAEETPGAPDRAKKSGAKPGIAARVLFSIPVIGWMLRDAATGRDSAAGFFAFNIAAAALISTYFFGLPALVLFALGAAALVGVGLILITQG